MKLTYFRSLLPYCLFVFFIALFSIFPLFYSYHLYKKNIPDSQAINIINKVNRLLPFTMETPRIAVIADKEALKNQHFFDIASAGNFVLFYPQSHKTVIYDPHQDIILKIGDFILPEGVFRPL